MKNILVTGANGQLGNEMRVLSAEYKEYTCFFTDVAELDICDEQAVMTFVKENNIHVIVNCAAYTAVDKAEDDIELCTKLNKNAVSYLAKAAEANWGEFIQISTDYVFDGTKHLPYNEGDVPCPNSVYGKTKLAGETNALEYCKKTMIIRTAWLYSTFGNNFVKTMLRLGKEKETLGVVFDQIGTPTYTLDLSRLLVDMIETDKYGYYHATNEGGYISWYDFTKEIFRQAAAMGHPEYLPENMTVNSVTTAEYGASKAARPFNSRLDKSKLTANGFTPLPTWQDALGRYLKELDF